jgi:hypothetical protein
MIEPQDLCLIAVVNNRRDLEMARLLGWYRIPLRYAPKIVRVDAVAFYQTAEFGEEKWSIRYAARVNGVELVRRIDLIRDEPDHPRAWEEYFKLQLGPVFPLPHPITAGLWRRITFLYTTGERVISAMEIRDLAVHDQERNILFGALRDRGMDGCFTGNGQLDGWGKAIDLFFQWTDEMDPGVRSHDNTSG